MKKSYKILILLSLIFLALRFLLALSVKEIGNIEIFHIGTIAKDIIEGLIMPFWDYQFSSYDGGTLLSGILVVPFFLLFGQTAFSFYLVAVIFSLGTLILWFLFLKKYFSERVAYIFSVLFIVSPYLFIRSSIVLAANHIQIVFFNIWFLFVFYKVFFNEKENKDLAKYNYGLFVLGFISGLGTWFCYSFLVVLFVGFLFWYLCSKRFALLTLIAFLGGYLAGYSPAFFRMKTFAPLLGKEIFGELLCNDLSVFGSKMKGLFQINLSGESPDFLNCYWIGFILLLVVLMWKNRKHFKELMIGLLPFKKIIFREPLKELPILLYPVFFLIIYGLSNFNIIPGDTVYLHYRYLIPLFPFIFAIIALAVDYLLACKIWFLRMMGSSLIVMFLFLSIGDTALHLRCTSFPNYAHLRAEGSSYEMFGTVICWRFKTDRSKSLRLLNSIKSEHRGGAYRGFGFEMAITTRGDELHVYSQSIPDANDRNSFIQGYKLGFGFNYFKGTELGESYSNIIKDTSYSESIKYFHHTVQRIGTFPEKYKSDCYKGLGVQYSAFFETIENIP